ncbi:MULTISPECIES: hypothetical protein [Providencia]|uniref:hypothetical protein n=1 Tax=Providencia TaxID=586 RepID=UPI00234919DB|nr:MULTISPECIES: hypothetical protein [unclassified Providencia]HEM8291212.1 hypothetical protein [Providencia stuartii]
MNKYLMFIFATIFWGASASSQANTTIPNDGLNKYCQDEEQTMDEIYENGALTKCYFAGSSLSEAYKHYRSGLIEDGQLFLAEKLVIKKNMAMPCPVEGCIAINYRWDGDKKLNIVQEFEGGETHLQFTQDNQGTTIAITQHMD